MRQPQLGPFRLLALALATPLLIPACGSADAATSGDDGEGDAAPPVAIATDAGTHVATTPDAATPPVPLELHFAFVSGLEDPAHYATADHALKDLEKAVLAEVAARAPAYDAAHHVKLTATSVRINVYTDVAGNVPSPGTDDGTGDEVAQHWRSQLALKLGAAFKKGEKNIILVGHSTGARAAMEIAADVGGPGNELGAGKWGWKDRIAGVVTAHGMLDALGKYPSVARIVSFELGCKVAKKSGWCEYAANVSAWPAADWVATNRRSLVLTGSYDDCGFPIWAEDSDNALPLRAQGSPASVGLGLAKTASGAYSAAHGTFYGNFCHSDITAGPSPRHGLAVKNATKAISTWLFDSAPRVANPNDYDQVMASSDRLAGGTYSEVHKVASSCPATSVAKGTLQVVGNCSHPGSDDGDDHAMAGPQLLVTSNGSCGGTVQWKNIHTDAHAGTVWFKSYDDPEPAGVLATLDKTSP